MDKVCLVCKSSVIPITTFEKVALLNKPIAKYKTDIVAKMEVFFCRNCDHISTFADGEISQNDLQKQIYQELYSNMTPTSISQNQINFTDRVLDIIRQNIGDKKISILEIGFHDGYIIGNLSSDGHQCYGVEPSIYAEIVKSKYPNINIKKCFFESATFDGQKFDLIIARHVLEHVPDPQKLVRDISDSLSPNGIAYIEVPASLYSLENCFYPEFHVDHISYFTPKSFSAIHQTCGLANMRYFEIFESYLKFPFMAMISSKGNSEGRRIPAFYYSKNMVNYAERFRDNFELYRNRLKKLFGNKKIGIWGAGSMANRYILDSGASVDEYFVFDINSSNIGSYISVSGSEVLNASRIPDFNVDTILIASAWEDDVKRQLANITTSVKVVGFSDLIKLD